MNFGLSLLNHSRLSPCSLRSNCTIWGKGQYF
ncbi:unnamed protein product, partial [Vitis vinifera]|uniref:Uncharacterized protein n=1 Tax=Vitis vinifera TaxID=29760 RepID=D7TSU3_VITVI